MERSDDLPEHSIRFSRKAKRVVLRVVPGKGLEVVIPESSAKGLAASFVPALLRRNKAWIDKATARLARAARDKEAGSEATDRLFLNGGSECVLLEYEPWPANRRPRPRLREYPAGMNAAPHAAPGGEPHAAPLRLLRLTGGGRADYLALLRRWVKEEAAARFGPRIRGLSLTHNLPFAGLSFRFQKSRWGSCSARGNISLNASLLFLPDGLSEYILLHELCHTRHLNHSESYWKLVFSFDPEALEKDARIRRAWRFVPGWLMC